MRCPFPHHRDSTPSFTIYTETESFHCFGCNTGGNLPRLMTLLGDPVPKDMILKPVVSTIELNFNPEEELIKRIMKVITALRKSRYKRKSQVILNARLMKLIERLKK